MSIRLKTALGHPYLRATRRSAVDRNGKGSGFPSLFTGGTSADPGDVPGRDRTPTRNERERGYAMWAVDLKETGTFVGQCGLQPVERTGPEIELAYHFNTSSSNKGYATEVAIAVLAYAFASVGLDRVIALVFPENVGSWRVAEKAGMRFDRIATYCAIEGLKKYVAEREWWSSPLQQ